MTVRPESRTYGLALPSHRIIEQMDFVRYLEGQTNQKGEVSNITNDETIAAYTGWTGATHHTVTNYASPNVGSCLLTS